MSTFVRIGEVRVPRHTRRWHAAKANRTRPGVKVRPLRTADSCDQPLAPPRIVSMSEDQFARAVGILAEMLAERAGSVEGDSPSTSVVIRHLRE
jgi:hypothetical protein